MNRRTLIAGLGVAGVAAPLMVEAALGSGMTASSGAFAAYRTGTLTISTISRHASELAMKRARNPHVLDFSHLEIAEQLTVGRVLTNVQNPPYVTLGSDDKAALAHLASLPVGEEFEQAYIGAEIGGHEKLLGVQQQLLREESLGSDSSHIATFLSTFIHEHLELLGKLKKA